MEKIGIHIEIEQEHPAYQWAKKQSDSVNAFGHIGTHLDCYTKSPKESEYELDTVVLNCKKVMPQLNEVSNLDITHKALILYTGNLHENGYGTKDYGKAQTFLTKKVLEAILAKKPEFILIDGCGIGAHGEEHVQFDKQCEASNCFVIENIHLTDRITQSIAKVQIQISQTQAATGKPCQVYALCKKDR